MIFIAHRGNISGKQPNLENTPEYVLNALNIGLNVETDVWYIDGQFFLGHKLPQTSVKENFLLQKNLWIHAKNIETLYLLKNKCNCFFHNKDDCVLTSKGFIWVYPGKPLISDCVAVLPEITKYPINELKNCYAICTDHVKTFYDKINNF
jgi:hypothetical protein